MTLPPMASRALGAGAVRGDAEVALQLLLRRRPLPGLWQHRPQQPAQRRGGHAGTEDDHSRDVDDPGHEARVHQRFVVGQLVAVPAAVAKESSPEIASNRRTP
jgi:hypothetical protein